MGFGEYFGSSFAQIPSLTRFISVLILLGARAADGYKKIMSNLKTVASHLQDKLLETGHFEIL